MQTETTPHPPTESQFVALNGFDTQQLKSTVDAIQENKDLANFEFRANGAWVDGGHNQTTIAGYYGAGQEFERTQPFVFDKDEPPILLGKDKGANPVEYVLAALAGCMTTSMVLHTTAQGQEVRSIESAFKGDIDLRGFLGLSAEVRNGYKGIQVKFKVDSDADEEQLKQRIRMSPVLDIITNPTPVSIEVEKV